MRSIREQLIRSLCTWPGESQARVSLVSVDKFAPSFANPIRILPPVCNPVPSIKKSLVFDAKPSPFARLGARFTKFSQLFVRSRNTRTFHGFSSGRAEVTVEKEEGRGGRNRERENRITHPCRVIGNSRARASLNLAEWRG